VELRVNIYSKIWSACSEEARAEVRKDLLFNATHEEGIDPLKLWEMLVRHCSVVSKSGDSRGARMAAEKSFGTPRGFEKTSNGLETNELRTMIPRTRPSIKVS
jgi:hypothetical protein